jgi:hypothetical protein
MMPERTILIPWEGGTIRFGRQTFGKALCLRQ